MNEKLFKFGDLEIWKREDRFYIRYDAGAHQVVMREDEISGEEALLASRSKENATKLLWTLQKRLIDQGMNPYVSNLKE